MPRFHGHHPGSHPQSLRPTGDEPEGHFQRPWASCAWKNPIFTGHGSVCSATWSPSKMCPQRLVPGYSVTSWLLQERLGHWFCPVGLLRSAWETLGNTHSSPLPTPGPVHLNCLAFSVLGRGALSQIPSQERQIGLPDLNRNTSSSQCGSVVMNPTSIHEDACSIPGLAQWVKDPGLHELWCRSQMQLGSGVAVALA